VTSDLWTALFIIATFPAWGSAVLFGWGLVGRLVGKLFGITRMKEREVFGKRQVVQVLPPEHFRPPAMNFNLDSKMAEGIAAQVANLRSGETIQGMFTPTRDGGVSFMLAKIGAPVDPRDLIAQITREVRQGPAFPSANLPQSTPALLERSGSGVDLFIINERGEKVFIRHLADS
jgi:hypothetical protein